MTPLLEAITDRQTATLEKDAEDTILRELRIQGIRLERMGLNKALERNESEWAKDADDMASALYLLLRRPWHLSFRMFTASRGIVVRLRDKDRLFNEWAGDHSDRGGQSIVDTNREIVNRLARRMASGEQIARNLIERLWSDERAKSIAITETTRGITAGETSGAEMYRRETGKLLLPYWLTERDERVCPVCGPLDNEPSTVWRHRFNGPPAHPRCRCRLEWREV